MLSFFPENEKPDDEEKYIPLPFSIIEAEYKKKTTVPMLIANKEVRLSLAGAQDKVPVHLKDGSFYLPAGGAVSTHIIKPPMKNFPDTVWNEYFCMKLASACKLEAAAVSLHIMSFPLLLIKRYDRQLSENGKLIRLHQEDFCQALGYMPEMKYESEGGPGFKACAELIMQYCTRPAAEKDKLIKWTVFNFLIGNADAHSKNISLLYENNKISVAPFYDLLCTEIYPALSNKLSMGIGGKKDPDKIDKTSFEKLASEIHVKASYLIKSAEELSALMLIKAAELKEESLSKYNTNETVFDLIIDHIKRRSKIFL
jgi:serine/threonine-protein kinase HipA